MINVLDQLRPHQRAVVTEFVDQMMKEHQYHTAIAGNDIRNRYCKVCGSVKNVEIDDDHYFYVCVNTMCHLNAQP